MTRVRQRIEARSGSTYFGHGLVKSPGVVEIFIDHPCTVDGVRIGNNEITLSTVQSFASAGTLMVSLHDPALETMTRAATVLSTLTEDN